jgi:hypothetical protein
MIRAIHGRFCGVESVFANSADQAFGLINAGGFVDPA